MGFALVLEILGTVHRSHAPSADFPLNGIAVGEGGREPGGDLGHGAKMRRAGSDGQRNRLHRLRRLPAANDPEIASVIFLAREQCGRGPGYSVSAFIETLSGCVRSVEIWLKVKEAEANFEVVEELRADVRALREERDRLARDLELAKAGIR